MAYEKPGTLAQMGGVLGMVAAAFLLMGTIFVVVGVFSWRSAQEFTADGVDVMGHIEKRWESTHSCKDSNSDVTRTCTDFNIGYAYDVGGVTQHASSTTDYETYAKAEETARILVRYLPRDPSRNVTSFSADMVKPAGELGLMAWIFGGLGGLFAVPSAGALVWLFRKARAQGLLRETGTARGAVVVAREETNVTVNDRRMWRIRWKDDTGATGQSRGRAQDGLPQVGARITVYADPAGKLDPVWEGDAGSR